MYWNLETSVSWSSSYLYSSVLVYGYPTVLAPDILLSVLSTDVLLSIDGGPVVHRRRSCCPSTEALLFILQIAVGHLRIVLWALRYCLGTPCTIVQARDLACDYRCRRTSASKFSRSREYRCTSIQRYPGERFFRVTYRKSTPGVDL
jgi:hypothetical protein